jgi:hypothetical protein
MTHRRDTDGQSGEELCAVLGGRTEMLDTARTWKELETRLVGSPTATGGNGRMDRLRHTGSGPSGTEKLSGMVCLSGSRRRQNSGHDLKRRARLGRSMSR